MTKCDSLGPLVIFHTFAKCCVLRYYYYVGTGYVFFSSTASHDLRIFTIASIRSPDKEIYKEVLISYMEIDNSTYSPKYKGTKILIPQRHHNEQDGIIPLPLPTTLSSISQAVVGV